MNKEKIITSLYDHFKNTPKKLKIVCDWDEVIQACESYATWLSKRKDKGEEEAGKFFEYFKEFWDGWESNDSSVEYSPYGSKLLTTKNLLENDPEFKRVVEQQSEIKNSPNFYQQAPFLTIAEDLLKLIKEDKVERLIFLSAYDKRVFPNGDERKLNIVWNTFGMTDIAEEKQKKVSLQLIPFDSETQGQTKADWIKEHASDFDIVIDDNPNICKGLLEDCQTCEAIDETHNYGCMGCSKCGEICGRCFYGKVFAPYYPAIENQHKEGVLLVKNEVSELKKEDFSK